MSQIAARYAGALYAEAGGNSERIGAVLDAFVTAIRESHELGRFIASPVVGRSRKKALFAEVFRDPEDCGFLNFLNVLTDKGRLGDLSEIDRAYALLVRRARGIVEATVETAFPLDGEMVEKIRGRFRALAGARELRLTVKIDPSLVGGLRVVIGSTVYEGTARAQLDRMHDSLIK